MTLLCVVVSTAEKLSRSSLYPKRMMQQLSRPREGLAPAMADIDEVAPSIAAWEKGSKK
jgi:hypothetical protein